MLCCECSFVQLYGFCDSSEKAYGTVVYAQILSSQGVKVTLWSGMSCVVSPKDHSISKLELMACVLMWRLMTEVKKTSEKEIAVGVKMFFVGRILWSRCGGSNN